jgi:Holliday junction resolvase
MSRMQRTKGSAGERELARLIDEHLGVRLVRNLEQSRRGGHDLTLADAEDPNPVARVLARYAVEVKRYATASPALIRQWWSQAVEQALRASLTPCLAYREDRQDWRVVLPLCELTADLGSWSGVEWTAELSLVGFCAIVREAAATAQDAHSGAGTTWVGRWNTHPSQSL